MNSNERHRLLEMFTVRAEIAGLNFSGPALVQLVEDISDLDFESVETVLKGWGRTEVGFPHPAKIRAKIMPITDESDDAQIVANLIIAAVSKDGYTNPSRARERVGELGWAVVSAQGGWQHLCELLTPINEPTIKAQLRDLAKTVAKRAKRGELETPPTLPSPSGPALDVVKNTMAQLGFDNAE